MPIHESTRDRIRRSHEALHNTETRYRLVCRHIRSGDALCPRDYSFYRSYCISHGIAPEKVRRDASVDPVDYGHAEGLPFSEDSRYASIMARREHGEPVNASDYAFLCKYCRRHGMDIPVLHAVYMWD